MDWNWYKIVHVYASFKEKVQNVHKILTGIKTQVLML